MIYNVSKKCAERDRELDEIITDDDRFDWMFRGNTAYVADLERLGFEIR